MKYKNFFYLLSVSGVVFLMMVSSSSAGHNCIVIHGDAQYQYAETCFKEQAYQSALTAYKRFIHFFPEDSRVRQAKFKTGLCFFYLKDPANALEVFTSLALPFSESRISSESRFMASRIHMIEGKYGAAEQVLQNFLTFACKTSVQDRIYSELAWIYVKRAGNMEKNALDTAALWLDRISRKNSPLYHTDQIKDCIFDIRSMDLKNPVLAGALSIVPGAGFVYCRRYRDGLTAFLLNSALILAAAEAFDDGNAALGAVISFVEAGFYSGNIYGAVTSAHKYNKGKIAPVIQSLENHFHSREVSHQFSSALNYMIGFRIEF
ncbi:MAG: hypothetical protein U9P10_16075 [Thermodesulfobacteriota bacterium]|nr:hypothetical protein [Thermodesulfobacteriota bacterium]